MAFQLIPSADPDLPTLGPVQVLLPCLVLSDPIVLGAAWFFPSLVKVGLSSLWTVA